jgi:hypothetical protein
MKKMILSFCLWLGHILLMGQPPINNTQAFASIDATHSDFRKSFAFHFQTIGIDPQEDGSYVILVSEPPPHVDLDFFKNYFKNKSAIVETRKHKIGFDGWIKDVLVAIDGVNRKDVELLVKDLSKKLFFSDYKAYYTPLPYRGVKQYFLDENLNLEITPCEFKSWFLDKPMYFSKDGNETNKGTLSKLFNSSEEGLYYSVKPGFVAWVLNTGSNISNKNELIRKFVLDSDLILGVIQTPNQYNKFAIIARERRSNVYDLPPLRVETVQLLASASAWGLVQSYNLNNSLFVGKIETGIEKNWDWCPIELSEDIKHTEYGNLLNMTDVMIKSWSEMGSLNSVGFSKYPFPTYYPFKKSIFELFNDRQNGLSSLTYNWNTKGSVSTFLIDDKLKIGLISCTGALPMTYLPEGQKQSSFSYESEEIAQDYFANLQNPDLIRVVQYSSLYQIFKANRIVGKKQRIPNTEYEYHKLLKTVAFKLLDSTIKSLYNNESEFDEKLVFKNLLHNTARLDTTEWIKTPSLFKSKDTKNSIKYTGGHNIGVRIETINISSHFERNKLKRIGNIFGYNAQSNSKDLSKLNKNLIYAIAKNEIGIESKFSKSKSLKIRAVEEVFDKESKFRNNETLFKDILSPKLTEQFQSCTIPKEGNPNESIKAYMTNNERILHFSQKKNTDLEAISSIEAKIRLLKLKPFSKENIKVVSLLNVDFKLSQADMEWFIPFTKGKSLEQIFFENSGKTVYIIGHFDPKMMKIAVLEDHDNHKSKVIDSYSTNYIYSIAKKYDVTPNVLACKIGRVEDHFVSGNLDFVRETQLVKGLSPAIQNSKTQWDFIEIISKSFRVMLDDDNPMYPLRKTDKQNILKEKNALLAGHKEAQRDNDTFSVKEHPNYLFSIVGILAFGLSGGDDDDDDENKKQKNK